MAWNDTQTDSDSITSSEWNDMVSYVTSMPPSMAQGWNSHSYSNSSLIWDDSLKKFKAMKSGGGTGKYMRWYSREGHSGKKISFSDQ